MAIYKFYNVQLLPIDSKTTDFVGVSGYCKLFTLLGNDAEKARNERDLVSISAVMKNKVYFAPFEVTIKNYIDNKHIAYGTFLKFDEIAELFDTQTGDLQFKSKGNSSSKRYEMSFVFDPELHILAIQDTKGTPSRTPLIEALETLLERYVVTSFNDYTLSIHELTSAASLEQVLSTPKNGYRSFSAKVSFSNSDKFDAEFEKELAESEQELKDNNVHSAEVTYKTQKEGLMPDLPHTAKVMAWLATKFGNVNITYKENHELKTFHMQDYPVRLPAKTATSTRLDKALEIKKLIHEANKMARASINILKSLRSSIDGNDNDNNS